MSDVGKMPRRQQDDALALTSHNWWHVIARLRYQNISWTTYNLLDCTTEHGRTICNMVESVAGPEKYGLSGSDDTWDCHQPILEGVQTRSFG